MKSDSTMSDLELQSTINRTIDEDDSMTCWQKFKRIRFLAVYLNYEYANDIKLFPVGFKDPMLQLKYDLYRLNTIQTRLTYGTAPMLVYFIFNILGVVSGPREMVPLKLGRLFILILGFFLAYLFNLKWKYTTDIVMATAFICLGMLNIYFLRVSGEQATITGWVGEIIGNEATTFCFVLFCFLHNSPKYCMFVLTPIYLVIHILMLISVLPDLDENRNKLSMAATVLNRIIIIAITVLFSQFLLVVQEAELLLKNKNIRKQQKQLVTVFNNQPEGVILTSQKTSEGLSETDSFQIELCNASVQKILGYTPSKQSSEKKSIMKQSSEKLINTPMFVECRFDSENKIIQITDEELEKIQQAVTQKRVRFEGDQGKPVPKASQEDNRLLAQSLGHAQAQYARTDGIQNMVSLTELFHLGQEKKLEKTRIFQVFIRNAQYQKRQKKIVSIYCNTMYYENKLCQFFTIRDITKERLYKEVKQSHQKLQIFSASVSHEMLNPLRSIIAFADQLCELERDKSKREILNMIYCSARLLQCHAQDLLDQNLLKENQFCLKTTDLSDLKLSVIEIIKLMVSQAQMKKIEIKTRFKGISDRQMIYFDKQRFQQVLLNLISNSIKFSYCNSTISIQAELRKQKDPDCMLLKCSVLDQGIGITEQDQKQLFQAYFKSGEKSSQQLNPSGNGLGLYISRQICMAAGGSLEVHSQPMVGSDFTFTMEVRHVNMTNSLEKKRKQKAFNSRARLFPNDKESFEEEKKTKQIQISQRQETENSTSWVELRIEGSRENQEGSQYRHSTSQLENSLVKDEQGTQRKKDVVFFADDFYICHQSIQLQFEALSDDQIMLQTFICGKDLLQKLQQVLDEIVTSELGAEVRDIQPVKLVICDISMPQMDGWETIKQVKEIYEKKQQEIDSEERQSGNIVTLLRPYLVFHTARYIDSSLKREVKAVGIDAIFEKPISNDGLMRLLYNSNIKQDDQ